MPGLDISPAYNHENNVRDQYDTAVVKASPTTRSVHVARASMATADAHNEDWEAQDASSTPTERYRSPVQLAGCPHCPHCNPSLMPHTVAPAATPVPRPQLTPSEFQATYGVPDIDRLPPSSSPALYEGDFTMVISEDEAEGAGWMERKDVLIRDSFGALSTMNGKRVRGYSEGQGALTAKRGQLSIEGKGRGQ